jgi:hypothetical protein
MIPLWTFTLGQLLLDQNNIEMPYLDMMGTSVGLLTLLAIGVLLRKYKPDFTRTLVRFLKLFLVVVIIILGILCAICNLYIFKILTWNVS